MIEIINRSLVAMNSRTDLFINVVFLLCIFLLDATKVESQTGLITLISPRDVNVFLQEGDQLNIEFRSTVRSSLYRYVDGKRRLMDSKEYSIEQAEDGRSYYLRVSKSAISAADAGQYICVTRDRGDGDSEEISVRVQLARITPTNGELQKEFDDVTLSCAVSGMATYTVDWKRDGKPLAGDKFVLSENKQSLTIKKANRIDVGQYECVFTPEPVGTGAGKVTGQAIVTSVPFVDAFHGSVSPLHGDEVIIDCKVYGEPAPEVSWTKDGTKLENSTKTEMDVLKIDEKNGRLTARLTIRNLEYEDRAKYGCLAITNSNNSTQEILVRVKDRYAALYPFIGICVEVIIIVIIIFIYEKRKTKSSDDDSDSGGKTNSHDQRGDVRQRNTVRT